MSRSTWDTALSPRLAELARPPVQDLSHAAQAKKLGVAVDGPGSLVREGNRVLVEVRFNQGAIARLDALRAAGGRILSASRRYQTVTVAVQPAALHGLADVREVGRVEEVRAPIVYGAGEATTSAIGVKCEGGSIVSEGAGPPQDQLHVTEARSKYGVDGSGITVGVLSDSYDKATKAADGKTTIATHASDDVASSDLPGSTNSCSGQTTPVNVLQDFAPKSGDPKPTDEGRAMLQIVHDIAPAAKLAFATAFVSEQSFAQNIEGLAGSVSAGGAAADVIVDDVAWFNEPFFQDGPVAAAINKVTSEGVAYFSAAGNDNLFDGKGNEIASWEAPEYRDAHSCPSSVVALSKEFEELEEKIIEEEELTGVEPQGLHPDHCMNFDPDGDTDTEFSLTVEPERTLTVDLQWAEPWYGVSTDLDAFLVDDKGQILEASLENNAGDLETEEGATQQPVEILQWENGPEPQKVRLVINRFSGSSPRLKFAFLENGRGVSETEYPETVGDDVVGPTIFGHAGASTAITVAAVPYNDSSTVEQYSSRGPVVHHFGPVIGTTAASPLPAPERIDKPNIAATDCGATTFFAFKENGEWRFCGTSAAAPHAAGIAALELDARPGLQPKEVRDAQIESATPIGSLDSTATGAGLLDADRALGFVLSTGGLSVDTVAPVPVFTEIPPALSNDRRPSFSFSASEAGSFRCSLDGEAPLPCSSPFEVEDPLLDGSHSFEVLATDLAGNTGRAVVSFAVDATAPQTFISSHPRKFIRASKRGIVGVLRFRSNESNVVLACKIDRGLWHFCRTRIKRRFKPGRHTITVKAQDEAGNVDPTPAVYRFVVRRRR
jgi:subtilisin family serine protease